MTPEQKRRAADLLNEDARYLTAAISERMVIIDQWTKERDELRNLADILYSEAGGERV